jgi:hypothetical protein
LKSIRQSSLGWARSKTLRGRGKKQNFLDDLSNSGWLVVYMVKAGQPARPNAVTARRPLQADGEIMAQYLVAIPLPEIWPAADMNEMLEASEQRRRRKDPSR